MERNFDRNFDIDKFIEDSIRGIENTVGDKKLICALSGGVDSSVAAVMVNKAVGDQLTCIFVDHGLIEKAKEIKWYLYSKSNLI